MEESELYKFYYWFLMLVFIVHHERFGLGFPAFEWFFLPNKYRV